MLCTIGKDCLVDSCQSVIEAHHKDAKLVKVIAKETVCWQSAVFKHFNGKFRVKCMVD